MVLHCVWETPAPFITTKTHDENDLYTVSYYAPLAINTHCPFSYMVYFEILGACLVFTKKLYSMILTIINNQSVPTY